jgi:hypothetical protein
MTQSEEKEYLIRGKTIALTAQIEAIVASIMLISNIANPRDELVELKGLMINEKLKRAKEILKKFHPNVYKKAKPLFRRYKKISVFRNQIAHCVFEWNDPTLLSFCVWDIKDSPDGHYFDLVRYSVQESDDNIELLQQFVYDFGELVEMVKQAGGYAALMAALSQANPRKIN